MRENGNRNERREWKKEFFHFFFLIFSSLPQTPLHYAAYNGSVECVNELIKHGADMAAKDVRSERVCGSSPHKRIDEREFV